MNKPLLAIKELKVDYTAELGLPNEIRYYGSYSVLVLNADTESSWVSVI